MSSENESIMCRCVAIHRQRGPEFINKKAQGHLSGGAFISEIGTTVMTSFSPGTSKRYVSNNGLPKAFFATFRGRLSGQGTLPYADKVFRRQKREGWGEIALIWTRGSRSNRSDRWMLMGVELVQAHDGLGSVSGLPARLGGWNPGIGMLANPENSLLGGLGGDPRRDSRRCLRWRIYANWHREFDTNILDLDLYCC